MTQPQAKVHVVLDVGVSEEELEAVKGVLRSAGLDAEVQPGIVELSAEPGPWVADLVSVGQNAVLVIAAFFGAVGAGFAQKAGQDAWDEFRGDGWRGLKRFMQELTFARGGSSGRVTLRGVGHPDMSLDSGLPDDAYKSLADLDWSQLSEGTLGWNRETGEWWWLPPGGRARRAPD